MTQDQDVPATKNVVVVGIGASAGGLEALQDFLAPMPDRLPLAIVIVQHLDPDHDSLMLDLLRKRTSAPVTMATHGQKVEAGHIYLIAPGETLTIVDGILHTSKFTQPRGRRRPIDDFLLSLAKNSGGNGVAIVLSGTGSDGSLGARAVKASGGLVLVQEPTEAKYDGMPRNAIETGASDIVLPVGDMVGVLADYFSRMGGIEADVLTDGEFIQRAMRHVRYRTGHDFSNYKPGTLLRRIAVRMSLLGLENPNAYLRLLVDDPAEAKQLFSDVLINVTRFFRDKSVFDDLQETVIPALLDNPNGRDEVRIWVPGCATGQEAYSIGITVLEAMERMDIWPKVSIFATDIDDDALHIARQGIFPHSISDEVPEDLLQKYFKWKIDGYGVVEPLRNMVRFSNQSLIKDPPFSQLDLVSCRNLLIYFDKSLQDNAMRTFHFALREDGFLVLGTSEAPSIQSGKFAEISRHNHIYRRLPGPAGRLDIQPTKSLERMAKQKVTDHVSQAAIKPFTDIVMAEFAPPHMAIGYRDELLFASEKAARFLRLNAGRPASSVMKLVRPELENVLRQLLIRTLEPADSISQDVEADLDGKKTVLRITRKQIGPDSCLLVFRDDLELQTAARPPLDADLPAATSEYITALEADLDQARTTVRSTIEELETSNEELKSSNEEMMSMNEELQSANEELTTANDELNGKIAEVREANSDMANFIRSTRIITVFLDDRFRLRTFTPEARNLFRFVTGDIGRRLDDIGSDLDVQKILEDCRAAMAKGDMMETEYQTRKGDIYRARLIPYEADGGTNAGIVFSLFDVTEIRHLAVVAEEERELSRQRLIEIEDLYDTSPQAMGLLSKDLVYLRANRKMAEIGGFQTSDLVGKPLGTLAPGLSDAITKLALEVLSTGKRIENFQLAGDTEKAPGDAKVWETDWYPVHHEGEVTGIGVNVRDITDQVRMQFELRRVMQELQHRVKNMLANVLALVSRARRDATVDKAIFGALSQRIQALAQTHKLLTQSNWASAELRKVLEPELLSVYGAERVKLKGPEIIVNARAALSLGMAIHELATNAAKYGGFSTPDGGVSLTWMRQDDGETDLYIFDWREHGGPPPTSNSNEGFGSQLIRSTINGSLNGEVSFSWEQTGLHCVFRIPVNTIIEIPHDSIFDTLET